MWTYLPVESILDGGTQSFPKDHVQLDVKDGSIITLAGGFSIAISRDRITIEGEEIQKGSMLNVFVSDKGRIEPDTFIRTFE